MQKRRQCQQGIACDKAYNLAAAGIGVSKVGKKRLVFGLSIRTLAPPAKKASAEASRQELRRRRRSLQPPFSRRVVFPKSVRDTR